MKKLMKEFKQRATEQGIKVTNVKPLNMIYLSCTTYGKKSGKHENCVVPIENDSFPIFWDDNYLVTIWRDERGVTNG